MTTPFVPEVGTITIDREPITKKGLLNAPAVGTRIRATLGETVIVGKVHSMQSHAEHEVLYVKPDGQQNFWDPFMSCWIEAGWAFEILPPLAEEAVSA